MDLTTHVDHKEHGNHASSELSLFGYPKVGGGGVTEPQ